MNSPWDQHSRAEMRSFR